MVDEAPPAEAGAARARRAAARARAGRAQRRVRPPRAAPGVRRARSWSGPTRRCCARSRWRAASRRCSASAGSRAGRRARDRGRRRAPRAADAETCARVFCALFPRLCANAATIGDALALLRPASAAPRPRAAATDGAPLRAGRAAAAGPGGRRRRRPASTSFRDADGQAAVRRQVGARAHPRARALRAVARRRRGRRAPRRSTTSRTISELGALVLENRLDPRAAPAGQHAAEAPPTTASTCAAAWTSRSRSSRSGREPARRPRRSTSARCAAAPPRPSWSSSSNSLFGLRHCGRRLPRREHPSAYGQMGRCLSPCLGDLDPNLYRRRLDAALARADAAAAAAPRCSTHVDGQMRAASAARRYERAAWLRRRRARLEVLLRRAGDGLRAVESGRAAGARRRARRVPRSSVLDRRRPGRRLGSAAGAGRTARAHRRRAASPRRAAARRGDRRGADRGDLGRVERAVRARRRRRRGTRTRSPAGWSVSGAAPAALAAA